jgi:hypothetical protein
MTHQKDQKMLMPMLAHSHVEHRIDHLNDFFDNTTSPHLPPISTDTSKR